MPSSSENEPAAPLVPVVERLSQALAPLRFTGRVAHVYNPLDYARAPMLEYLRRFARPGVPLMLLGMNPGPWGMGQTGVPFGAVPMVRDWLGIEAPVERPADTHPARPIEGFACARVEVSGTRLWGWLRERFGTPAALARHVFVWNYCPLLFLAESGKNITPNQLRKAEREAMQAPCDAALRAVVDHLRPRHVLGVGAWAQGRARAALAKTHPALRLGRILHPSPASPRANQGWAEQAEAELREQGVTWPVTDDR